ncbi:MAG: putative esterase YcpF (UPF0227 family) [Oceanicoccus sp.]|jgi:predicted esterase YcpF (UPF0227 family)
MRPLLIYIYGFLSSPQSQKAQDTASYLQDHSLPVDFLAPDLANYPMASYRQLQQIVEQHLPNRQVAVIGSSLGGFMATALAQEYGIKAVLVNPAVRPYELICHFLGDNVNPYSGEKFHLTEQHMQELQQLEVKNISTPGHIHVLLQAGDETLDYRQAVEFYQACSQLVEQGGDHRFQHFKKHLPALLNFLELAPAQ